MPNEWEEGETMSGWIGVDLDGTLAEYHDFVSVTHIGRPIMPMVERVRDWLKAGYDVRIFTARVDGGTAALAEGNKHGEKFADQVPIRGAIDKFCMDQFGKTLPITNEKDYGLIEIWDDRAIQVIPNTGIRADGRL